jgi:hypothetical protein
MVFDGDLSTFDWDVIALATAISVSAGTFFISMRIIRNDIARQERELQRWQLDFDYLQSLQQNKGFTLHEK